MTTQSLLQQLNVILETKGKKPLKSWKASVEKLKERIQKERLDVATGEADGNAPNPQQLPKETKPKKAPKKKPSTKPTAKKSSDDISVVDIAAQLGINPKVARAKLRRAGLSSSKGRWKHMAKGSDLHKHVLSIFKEKAGGKT